MKIKGIRHHLSITPFEVTELPSLTVLVGINGSGKSHLLQAIENGAVITDILRPLEFQTEPFMHTPADPGIILRLENGSPTPSLLDQRVQSNLTVSLQPPVNPGRGPSSQDFVLMRFDDYRTTILETALDELKILVGVDLVKTLIGEDIWRVGEDEILKQIDNQNAKNDIRLIFEKAERLLISNPPNAAGTMTQHELQMVRSAIGQVSERLGISPLLVTAAQARELNKWGGFTAFDPHMSQIFGSYRDAHTRNDLQSIRDKRNGTEDSLEDSAFIERYGLPPWELVSSLLETFGLNYRVAEPPSEPTESVGFVLERADTKVPVAFSALSSGERVLLRFGLSLLKLDPLRVGIATPKLLLLDEMDASLHPEMVHRWLTAIADGLVIKKGINCILTTHSATTVALAPEESLFELVKGTPIPRKVTKQEALNRLTFGVPTLSIDYSGRRQVFVESDTDAETYESIATIMKSRLALERTLTFISTGIRRDNVETNTGCTIVKKVVDNLADNGSISVFGIIDWDGVNQSSKRVVVLAQDSHYALDNVILDPLLLGILLIRDSVQISGLDATFSSVSTQEPDGLQKIVDAIQSKIQYAETFGQQLVESRYQGGLILKVAREHQISQGHRLEGIITDAHPSLKRYSQQGRGQLTKAIINKVLVDYPALCPMPIVNVFRAIASRVI